MNNYFRKLTTFDVDKDKLYNEWYNVAIKYNLLERAKIKQNYPYNNYFKSFINYPTDNDENFDPVFVRGEKNNDKFGNNDFRIENIIKDYQGSHTAEVVTQVYDYLTPLIKSKYKVNAIKHHVLEPRSKLSLHTDGTVEPRFFLIASVSQGCYMQVLDDKIPMHETGSLFRMITTAPHSPVNDTDEYRVTIVFDVVHI